MIEIPRWIKRLLEWNAVVAVLIGFVLGGFSVYGLIRSAAQSAVLGDPAFLNTLAEKVRPVCLLNSKGIFYDDYGALSFIERTARCEVATNRETMTVRVRAKQFLRQPPLLTSLDGSLYLIGSEREDTDTWRYTFGAVVTRVDASMGFHQLVNTNTVYAFRVEILH